MTKPGFAWRGHFLRDDSRRDGVSGVIERLV
jgi:hypothetical protein